MISPNYGWAEQAKAVSAKARASSSSSGSNPASPSRPVSSRKPSLTTTTHPGKVVPTTNSKAVKKVSSISRLKQRIVQQYSSSESASASSNCSAIPSPLHPTGRHNEHHHHHHHQPPPSPMRRSSSSELWGSPLNDEVIAMGIVDPPGLMPPKMSSSSSPTSKRFSLEAASPKRLTLKRSFLNSAFRAPTELPSTTSVRTRDKNSWSSAVSVSFDHGSPPRSPVAAVLPSTPYKTSNASPGRSRRCSGTPPRLKAKQDVTAMERSVSVPFRVAGSPSSNISPFHLDAHPFAAWSSPREGTVLSRSPQDSLLSGIDEFERVKRRDELKPPRQKYRSPPPFPAPGVPLPALPTPPAAGGRVCGEVLLPASPVNRPTALSNASTTSRPAWITKEEDRVQRDLMGPGRRRRCAPTLALAAAGSKSSPISVRVGSAPVVKSEAFHSISSEDGGRTPTPTAAPISPSAPTSPCAMRTDFLLPPPAAVGVLDDNPFLDFSFSPRATPLPDADDQRRPDTSSSSSDSYRPLGRRTTSLDGSHSRTESHLWDDETKHIVEAFLNLKSR